MKKLLRLVVALATLTVLAVLLQAAGVNASDPPPTTAVQEVPISRFPLAAPTTRTNVLDIAIVGDTIRLPVIDAKLGIVYGDSMRPVAGNGTIVVYTTGGQEYKSTTS